MNIPDSSSTLTRSILSSRKNLPPIWLTFLLLRLLLSSSPALPQQLLTEILTLDDGLPSSSIIDLDQDALGRLWILGRGGVTVYDGRNFSTYTSADGLSTTNLNALTIDATNRAWVVSGSEPTIYRLDGDRWSPLPTKPPGFSDTSVFLEVLIVENRALVAFANGDLGVWLWQQQGDGTFPEPTRPEGNVETGRITAMEPLGDWLAIAGTEGLCSVDSDKRARCDARERDPRLAAPIHALLSEPREGASPRLWILGEAASGDKTPIGDPIAAWLGYLQDGELTVTTEFPSLPRLILRPRQMVQFKTVMLQDANDGLYIGNPAAIYYLDPEHQQIRNLHLRQGLATTGAFNMLLDYESSVWIGSLRGLTRIASRRFLSFDQKQGLLEDEVTSVVEPSPGRFILGHNLGLSFLDGDQISTLTFERLPGLARNDHRALDMEVGEDGELWLTTPNLGLRRVDRSHRVTEVLPKIHAARSLARDPEGRLWVVGSEGLFMQTEDGFALRHKPPGIDQARWLDFTQDGQILISTTRGLLTRKRQGDWQHIHAPNSDGDSLYGILERSSGEIWIGSAVGPHILRANELVPVGHGFPDLKAPVFSVFEDRQGQVWLGTDDGVYIWDGSTLRHLTNRHGLIGRETNRGAGFIDHSGRVWIGTDRGVSIYQQQHDRTLPTPRIEITGLEINGEIRTAQSLENPTLRLKHQQNTLSFKFRTVAFSKEEPLEIRYLLEGFDRRPKETAALSALDIGYTNLPPGRYCLRLSTRWRNGEWSEEQISPMITISRPLWRTYPFYAAFLILIVGSIWGAYQFRTRTIRARGLELEAMNQKLRDAAEERERLIANLEAQNVELEHFSYTVSHDLKSPLVTIRGFLGFLRQARVNGDYSQMDTDIDRIDNAAEKMGRLLEELLDLARVGQIINPPETIPLRELIREVTELSAANIRERRAQIEIAPDLPEIFGDRLRLRMVFQNLVDNALKFTSEDRTPVIAFHAETQGDRTQVTVTDNGEGIPEAQQKKIFGLFKRLDPGRPGTGIGLALVQRIIKAHGGEIWVESDGPGLGSRFGVVLPKERDPEQEQSSS